MISFRVKKSAAGLNVHSVAMIHRVGIHDCCVIEARVTGDDCSNDIPEGFSLGSLL